MKVRDPQGEAWRVSRRWVPWRRRAHRIRTGGWFATVDLDDGLLIGVLLFFFAPILVLALLVAGEFLLLIAVLPIAVLARMAFGKAWMVETRRGWELWCEAPAGGWRASGGRIHAIAEAIERGDPPLPDPKG